MAKKKAEWRTPEFMAKIGSLGGKAMAKKRGSKWMSKIAKRSHRNRKEGDYVGGRPTLEEQRIKALKK